MSNVCATTHKIRVWSWQGKGSYFTPDVARAADTGAGRAQGTACEKTTLPKESTQTPPSWVTALWSCCAGASSLPNEELQLCQLRPNKLTARWRSPGRELGCGSMGSEGLAVPGEGSLGRDAHPCCPWDGEGRCRQWLSCSGFPSVITAVLQRGNMG